MSDYVVLKDVEKNFSLNGERIRVLDKISFSLEAGDFLTVLGPSGCGKSTLIRCICGLEIIDGGSVRIDDVEVRGTGPDRIMVFQDFNQLFQWKSVLDNVVYPLRLTSKHKNKKELVETAEHYLRMVHLNDFFNAYPNQLSGGMRQRVAIARALAIQPKILLMDEPFGALDAQTRSILQKELQEIWQKTKTTIIFITHNIQESIILGNKILVMSRIPAQIKLFLDNNLDIPRMPETREFMDLWKKLYKNLDVKRF